ncbi:hypothetical protein GBAR_LOCUS18753 [Geodia barretti]|uniref:TRAF-type domain-containing protein n=1 Tax=Geodia barretti TaxID=519541 RepID=A0AA35SR86_GEOBA|nr:hypothetical protein GBAR_LOCUS18753 [Geodia barretti]
MRKDLKTHCDSTCRLRNVPCPFVEMGCGHHSIPHKQLTSHLLCGVPGHTVGLLESNQTVKETVAEIMFPILLRTRWTSLKSDSLSMCIRSESVCIIPYYKLRGGQEQHQQCLLCCLSDELPGI